MKLILFVWFCGIVIDYAFAACIGGDKTFTALTGTITSENYPNTYPSRQDCDYTIQAGVGKKITLTVEAFDLQYNSVCKKDFLQIDGTKYCGRSFGNNIFTTKTWENEPELTLRFRTNGKKQYTGFEIRYTITSPDPCAPNPCQSGGTCSPNADGTPNCACVPGYSGSTCQIDINDCEPNPCQNGGDCDDGVNSYTCVCATGYSGDDCVEFDECSTTPCANGGTCSDSDKTDGTNGNTFTCSCVLGYAENDCSRNINDCVTNPCQYGGTCVDGVNTQTCNCVDGYSGIICADVDYCFNNPCGSGGSCINGDTAYTCSCNTGYSGDDCEDFDECSTSPCRNGGGCTDADQKTADTFTCNCPEGYSGRDCSISLSGCDPNPCDQGDCVGQLPFGYTCNCNAGWTGTNCDVPECSNPRIIVSSSSPASVHTPYFYHGGYEDNHECSWRITADPGKQVHLTFQTFDIETHHDCNYDSLSVYDGSSDTSPKIGTYCGNSISDPENIPDIGKPYKSSGNTMYIVFVTDSSVTKDGVQYTIQTAAPDAVDPEPADACDGTPVSLTATSGDIILPVSGSSQYFANAECSWIISVPEDKRVKFTFNSFDVEGSYGQGCAYDKLELKKSDGSVFRELCGRSTPNPLKTLSGGDVTLVFTSDSITSGSGFSLSYVFEDLPTSSCGLRQVECTKDSKIYGGYDAVPGCQPWAALLLEEGRFICGASIIDEKWILTAAHCIDFDNPAKYTITIGEFDRSDTNGNRQTVTVSNVFNHPSYNDNTLNNDIALLELVLPLVFNDYIQPVCLPDSNRLPGGTLVTIMGHGSTDGNDPDILQVAEVPIVDHDTCSAWISDVFEQTMICAGKEEGGIDSCSGDSGGPLVYDDNGVFVQYGIVSWGYGCAEAKKPGVYTNVPNYLTFIESKINPAR